MANSKDMSERAVQGILTDLKDRRGLSQEWDQIDDGIQEEIVEKWKGLVREAIGIPTAPPFKDCRRYMANTLKCDEGLMIGYQANVAMFLHDRCGVSAYEERNKLATDLLWLIFES